MECFIFRQLDVHWIHIGCRPEIRVKESGLRIRVESRLREDFLQSCQRDDLTAAQVLRAFMRFYVEKRMRGEQIELFQHSDLREFEIRRERLK